MVFSGEQGVGGVELFDVVGAVVGWQSDTGERDFGSAGFECSDDVVEVGARIFDGQPRRPSLPPNSTITTAGCREMM